MIEIDMQSLTPPTARDWALLDEWLERQKVLRTKVTCSNMQRIAEILNKNVDRTNKPKGIGEKTLKGIKVADNIYKTTRGKFCVHLCARIDEKKKTITKFFGNIEDAVAFRDEIKEKHALPIGRSKTKIIRL